MIERSHLLEQPAENEQPIRHEPRRRREPGRDDDVLAALVHEGIDELLATDQSQQDLQHGQNLRWRLSGAAITYVSQVCKRFWGRSQQCLQCSVSRCITCMNRWILQLIRLSIGYKRTMSTLRVLLALGLAFALSYILVTIGRMRFPIGRGAKLK